MKTSSRKTDKKIEREPSKDDLVAKKKEEKLKKSVYSVPRSFVQKSSTADIYARKNSAQGIKAPKKNPSNRNSEISPMKDLLKSSSSSISQVSTKSYKTIRTPVKEAKAVAVSVKPEKTRSTNSSKSLKKKALFTNVTVSSPIAKRKLNLEYLNEKDSNEDKIKNESKQIGKQRERTNTRTLDEAEIKVLTSEAVDNNAEMLKLTKKLSAQPKSFFVDLDDKKKKDKSSDEEVSYEDDFESYESDFDSYHTEPGSDNSGQNSDDIDDLRDTNICDTNLIKEEANGMMNKEESKLDSGNFDLPDRSKTKPMDFIDEGPESNKKTSLTDEGFQDMSSGLSSMKTLHVDVLDRPLFIDFTKSKANKRKRKIYERLKQRAEDILSMVTLHEMSYNLFEMKPIPYDLYMATFGRFNYTQTASQTFEDGITEEVQTEEVLCHNKWTQHPIAFSNEQIHLNMCILEKNKGLNHLSLEDEDLNKVNINDTYIKNPLRIFFEQKDGAGSDTVLPYDKYKDKLKKDNYNVNRLRNFIKRVESKISNILSINAGNTDMSNLVKTSKYPFSTGYMSITTKDLDKKYLILKNTEITGIVFSETKNNLIITIHRKFTNGILNKKCALCLWDLSIARNDPIKLLLATDNVKIGKYRGNTDGFFVGALEDGSINLWDLSEEASWCNDIMNVDESSTKIAENSSNLTQLEMDREWNLKSRSNYEQQQQYFLQVSAFTSSGMNVCDDIIVDSIVGLEFTDYTGLDGSHIVAQICSLQRIGILTIWSIIHEKAKTSDIGQALWSKMKLEKIQTIVLSEYLEINNLKIDSSNFNLNAAKKRLALKKQERNNLKRQNSRPKSCSKFENDRLNNVAISKTDSNFWENGIVCSDLKIVQIKVDNYLVGKNYGEVLCCRNYLGAVKVTRFSVANTSSSVTCLQTSSLPYFLAATDCGTINLCSLLEYRVLLTLDCRNTPTPPVDKYQSDYKGRFMGSSSLQQSEYSSDNDQPITSMYWSRINPLSIVCVGCRVCVWSLAKSDLRALCAERALCCVGSDRAMAVLTPEGEVQVYKLTDDGYNYMELFQKYVALL